MSSGTTAISGSVSICFVAHRAYGALSGVDNGHAGGVERQQAMMARWLARRGHRVSMITWDEGQADGARVHDVAVFTVCRRDAGVPGLRFFHPRWTGLCRAMARADADVYYYNLGDMGLGQVALWCRRNSRRCVYSVASDPDCDARLPVLRPWRERILYRYGLRHADRIVVQSMRQQGMLNDGFGLRSTVIPMPCFAADFLSTTAEQPRAGGTTRVLWIGRFSKEKRLEWLLDVAPRCSVLHFDVLGDANVRTPYARDLVDRAQALPNVTLHGRLPWEKVLSFYGRSMALCCTSAYEGFPNTFLEAWAHGLPVVSTFDPDGRIAEKGLGLNATTSDEVAAGLLSLHDHVDLWQSISRSARTYFLDHHTPDAVMPLFEATFKEPASCPQEAARTSAEAVRHESTPGKKARREAIG